MSNLRTLQEQVVQFRDERNWKQFHTAKDMLLSLGLELAELCEHFQWKNEGEILELDRVPLGEELADILYWVLLLANDLGVDLEKSFEAKMQKNATKYPVEKAKGVKLKYSDL